MLAALFEKYGNNGSSMHGTAHDAGCELLRSMNAAAHVIVYNDPRENYVGVDVFTNFEAALACWDGEHQRAMGLEEERGVVHTVRNVKEQEFYFRTGVLFSHRTRFRVLLPQRGAAVQGV